MTILRAPKYAPKYAYLAIFGIFGCIFGLEAWYCQKFMKKLKIVFLPLATNSAEIVERVRGIMAAIPTSLIIESCVFLLVSCTISELAKK